jgi:RNA polymerase sigma-70 factor (ECF subfamily)
MISLPDENGLAVLSENRMRFRNDELVHGLRTPSTPAWAEIMAVHRPRVYAAALRLTHNHHDAEDVTQETFLRAFLAVSSFRGESSLGTWLIAIANNLARNHYWYWRRRKRDETFSIDGPAQGAEGVTLGETLASGDLIASAQTERDDLLNQLDQGLARLPARDREILSLRDRQHATYEHIARSLIIPLGTVKSRIARARAHLLEIVKEMIAADAGIEARPAGGLHRGLITERISNLTIE